MPYSNFIEGIAAVVTLEQPLKQVAGATARLPGMLAISELAKFLASFIIRDSAAGLQRLAPLRAYSRA